MDQPWASANPSGRSKAFLSIGPLEAQILARVWEHEPAAVRVREIYEQLHGERRIAYTTVLTVMGSLVRKGLLSRDESTTAFSYRAAIPAEEVAGQVLASVVAVLYRGRTRLAAARLLGLDGELTEGQFEELRGYGRRLLEG